MAGKLTIKQVMQRAPVMPVLVINHIDDALPLANALLDGGLNVVEITLRTPCALECIGAISKALPNMIVGAGTVNTAAEMKQVKEQGAQFAVSPGFTVNLHEAALDHDMPWLPGICSPGEILQAAECERHELKFFPAEQAGGSAFLAALKGPFQQTAFCPTGGINADSALDYLRLDNVLCVGGSWVTPGDAIKDKDWDRISNLAATASQLA